MPKPKTNPNPLWSIVIRPTSNGQGYEMSIFTSKPNSVIESLADRIGNLLVSTPVIA